MRAFHTTSSETYRTPIGAVPVGGVISLNIDVFDDDVQQCCVHMWSDANGEEVIVMQEIPADTFAYEASCAKRFSIAYTCGATGVYWYTFDITSSQGDVWRYGAQEGYTTGEGTFVYGQPPAFQITVFEAREIQPEWYRFSVAYQIFPDRFYRGETWDAEAARACLAERAGDKRRLIEDWDIPPTYDRNPDGSIATWDFYGGTLQGIIEKLDYLADLGIGVLYLNPIFEATSNHRYDTADFTTIDSLLGTEEDFRRLCTEAEKCGISIILDGVFNHCGADSRYFNRFGTYDEVGAYQSEDSPYRDWFFFREDGTYAGWWNNPDLPDLNEQNPQVQDLICGEQGIVRRWMRAGAKGWRLDVADELSDAFIAAIKRAVLEENPEAVLIGEVWEDASHKEAYGVLRQYFQGHELDGVMNYPFRSALIAFLRGEQTAYTCARALTELQENYPHDNHYSGLNLLGSHDRERILTLLGATKNPQHLSDAEAQTFELTSEEFHLGIPRFWLACLMQVSMPGVPCVYYGDEQGLTGLKDPYNRATYPWDPKRQNKDCFSIVRNSIALRKTLPALVDGTCRIEALNDDVLAIWRETADQTVCVILNASLDHAHTVQIPVCAPVVTEVLSGVTPRCAHGAAELELWPLGSAVVVCCEVERVQKSLERGMGVLAHLTSLPEAKDCPQGPLGQSAYRFVDWLEAGGQKYWQILPVNPTDAYGSPYAGLSSCAGNLAFLVDDIPTTRVAYASQKTSEAFRVFCEREQEWLAPYAAFRALKVRYNEAPWYEWDPEHRTYHADLLHDKKLRKQIEDEMLLQFAFHEQMTQLRKYANERGIQIIGDMPMYVSVDSSDVWSRQDLFELDACGKPRLQAGAPADHFSAEGQLWGNPVYRWDACRREDYAWWIMRLRRAFDLYDIVRLDHFIGFASYFAIEEGKSALAGTFKYGPGMELFQKAYEQLGPLPCIAEDLGLLTPAVRALLLSTGFMGMDIIQFADGDVRESYIPRAHTVTYTGTHDNQTLRGFCASRFGLNADEAQVLARKLCMTTVCSDAPVAIVALQDVLELDDDCRMNTPGTTANNWSWQAQEDDILAAQAHLAQLAEISGRIVNVSR